MLSEEDHFKSRQSSRDLSDIRAEMLVPRCAILVGVSASTCTQLDLTKDVKAAKFSAGITM